MRSKTIEKLLEYQYERIVGTARLRYECRVDIIAAKVRKQVVIPFCNKHKLKFTPGNGTWAFFDAQGNHVFCPGYDHIFRAYTPKNCIQYEFKNKTVDEVLETPVPDGGPLGAYMADYTPPKWGQWVQKAEGDAA